MSAENRKNEKGAYISQIEKTSERTRKILADWLEHRKNLERLLERAKKINDHDSIKQFTEQLKTADLEIMEGLQLMGFLDNEKKRYGNLDLFLEHIIRKVDGEKGSGF